jgi:hypothetical protein
MLLIMRILTLLLLLTYLGACAPQTAGVYPATFSTLERPVTLSKRLQLTAYPGSGILELSDRGQRVTSRFTSSVTAFDLMMYFESQLAQSGWQRTRYAPPTNANVDATFAKGQERINLRLTLEHPSGIYRLVIR